ncbi:FluG domain protein [Penicillium daleae]|uniref:FluG domain protein n=1 Tax=Penicillium daleae TaxID=63821 RepID=A0AAD6FY23_9EURO|nr:FluG domain protein [Penicillium daleae]KAJ5433517.1 FluG domain protein [Penicillium daleae]
MPGSPYKKRNDNLGLYVIQDILEYTFLDKAFTKYKKSLSASARSKTKGTLYKYRKEATINLRHLDEYSRNAIIGYTRSSIFAYYVSIRDNT